MAPVDDPAIRQLARAIRDLQSSNVTLERVQVAAIDPLALVGVDGDVVVDALGWYSPAVGDQVWVMRQQTRCIVLGSTSPNQILAPSLSGMVTAVSGSLLTVTVDGASQQVPFLGSYTPAVGDTVQLLWRETNPGQWTGLALGKTGSYVPPAPTPPKQTTASADVEVVEAPAAPDLPNPYVINVAGAACWRGSGWRTDTSTLYQGDWTGRGDNTTFFFYGGRFAALQGLTVTRADLRIHAGAGGPSAATTARCAIHGAHTRTPGRPSLTGATWDGPSLADGDTDRTDIPVSAAQGLVDNPRRGIALVGTGKSNYSAYPPPTSDPLQAQIRIWWTT